MQGNNDHINLDELAQEGWLQMKELLLENGLQKKPAPIFSVRGRLVLIIAACIAFLLATTTIFYNRINIDVSNLPALSASTQTPVQKPASTKPVLSGNNNSLPLPNGPTVLKNPVPKSASVIMLARVNKLPANTIFIPSVNLSEKVHEYIQTSGAQESECYQSRLETFKSDIEESVPTILQNPLSSPKEKNPAKRKPIFFAGIGMNISDVGESEDQPTVNGISLHPALRIQIPLSKKLRLQTGLNAFSTIHVKEAASIKKEEVNDLSADHLYTINKSSLIKAGYFQIPATVQVQLTPNWSVGGGIELGRLYQFKVKETEADYDYSGNLTATNYDRNLVIGTLAAPAKKDKLLLSKWNSALVAETAYQAGRFLISGSYHHGINPSVSIEDPNAQTRYLTNQYFTVGVQFRLNNAE